MSEPRAHFLLVGDVGDVATIRDTVAQLPVDAYGQVFLELPDHRHTPILSVPEGVSVTWLVNEAKGSLPGERAVAAVEAWMSEWVTERSAQPDYPCVLWVGCGRSARMEGLYRSLAARIPHLHVYHSA